MNARRRNGGARVWRMLGGCAVLVVLLVSAAGAGAVEPDAAAPASRAVADAVLAGDYPRAEQIAGWFRKEHPDHPAGPLMLASVIQYATIDYEDYSRGEEFDVLIGETVALADQRLDAGGGLWARYWRAAADGLAGARESVAGSVLVGIIRGRSGAVGMSRIVEDDSTFYDAYLLAGSYHFWKSVATGRIAWLPFIGDEKERGIDEVETAIRSGHLTGPLSATVLIEMLLDHDPARARDRAAEMVARYPDCRLFAWQLGEAYKKLGAFEEARGVFEGIAASMREDPADDGSGELRCWWKLAVLANDLDNRERCAEYCRQVIAAGEQPAVARRQTERIGRARELLEECEAE